MQSTNVSAEFSAEVEFTEREAWRDLYAALPAPFAHEFGVEMLESEGITLTRCKRIPFGHFNNAFDIGVGVPATPRQIDAVLAEYAAANVASFIVFHNPTCRPAELPQWFAARGLRVRGAWDRIVRDGAPLVGHAAPMSADLRVEEVTHASAGEWSGFIDRLYGLPTSPWLQALVGRPGWHHYLVRKQGAIGAVRSACLGADGRAWLGIDAPIPGLMAASFDLDLMLCRRIVADFVAKGAKLFVADIEAPSAEMNTPAYPAFDSLGFRKLYSRQYYGL